MRLLVTGGAGFIGSHFVRHALAQGAAVTNLDALTYAGCPANLADVAQDPAYRFVHGDIRDRRLVSDLMAGHDAVAHFAAESHVDRSIDNADEFLTTNVVGTHVVFEAAVAAGVHRLLHVSTDEVYGSVEAPRKAREDDPLAPNSPYSASKAAGDLLARAFRATHGLPVMVTRSTNNYGPNHFPEKMIPLFVTNLLDGKTVPVYGAGGQIRDWMHVHDNVRAQWLVLTEGEPGQTYNVGVGGELTNLEVTRRILERMGLGSDRIEFVVDRPGHDLRYAVDTARVRALGWAPVYDFHQGLDDTIDWYRANESWWRPLVQAGASRRRGERRP